MRGYIAYGEPSFPHSILQITRRRVPIGTHKATANGIIQGKPQATRARVAAFCFRVCVS